MPKVTYPCTKVDEGCGGPYCSSRDSLRPFGRTYNNISFGIEKASASTKRFQWITGVNANIENYYNALKNNSESKGHLHLFVGREDIYGHGIRLGARVGSIYRPEGIAIGNSYTLLPTIRVNIGYKEYFSLQANILDSDLIGAGSSFGEVKLMTNMMHHLNPNLDD